MFEIDDIAALKTRARESLQSRDLPRAHEYLLKVTASSCADAESWMLLGVTSGMAGNPAAAEQSFRRAIALQPDYPQAQLNLGKSLSEQGKHRESVGILRQVATRFPDNPSVFIALADALAQSGDLDEANRLIARILCLTPEYTDALVCQGNILYREGRLDEAIACYDRALDQPTTPFTARMNKGLILMSQGRLDEALVCLESAVKAEPNSSTVHCAIGEAYMRMGDRHRAEQSLTHAFDINPQNVSTGMQLAAVLRYQNKMQEAAKIYRHVLRIDPDNVTARFFVDAMTGQDRNPRRIPAEVIRSTYDHVGRGAGFDVSLLQQMQYKGPELLYRAVHQAVEPGENSLDILELGCGTGLCGSLLRQLAAHMVGVDLSAEMIETARRKEIYDFTYIEDLHDVLDRSVNEFDLVAGMDVFCCFGDLSEIIGKCTSALRPGGLLGFSIEKAEPGELWQFHHYGHFRHSLEYVRDIAASQCLVEESVTEAVLSIEMCEPRIGYVCLLRKPA